MNLDLYEELKEPEERKRHPPKFVHGFPKRRKSAEGIKKMHEYFVELAKDIRAKASENSEKSVNSIKSVKYPEMSSESERPQMTKKINKITKNLITSPKVIQALQKANITPAMLDVEIFSQLKAKDLQKVLEQSQHHQILLDKNYSITLAEGIEQLLIEKLIEDRDVLGNLVTAREQINMAREIVPNIKQQEAVELIPENLRDIGVFKDILKARNKLPIKYRKNIQTQIVFEHEIDDIIAQLLEKIAPQILNEGVDAILNAEYVLQQPLPTQPASEVRSAKISDIQLKNQTEKERLQQEYKLAKREYRTGKKSGQFNEVQKNKYKELQKQYRQTQDVSSYSKQHGIKRPIKKKKYKLKQNKISSTGFKIRELE